MSKCQYISSACKAQRWYESQSRRLNNEGEKYITGRLSLSDALELAILWALLITVTVML